MTGLTWLDVFFSVAPEWLAKAAVYVGLPALVAWLLLMMVLLPAALWRVINPPPKE